MPRKKKSTPKQRGLIGPILLTLICLFVWLSLLTFDAGDWPNPDRYPHNNPAANACGRAGAAASYLLFYWVGDGAWPLALFGAFAAVLWLVHGKIIKLLQRAFGLIVLVACTSAAVAVSVAGGGETLSVGPGGVLGTGLGNYLTTTFSGIGTFLVLAYGFVVGLLFTAEGWVLRLPGAVQKIREASGEAIATAREAVANAAPVTAAAGSGVLKSKPTKEGKDSKDSKDSKGDSGKKSSEKERPEVKINPGRSPGDMEKSTGSEQLGLFGEDAGKKSKGGDEDAASAKKSKKTQPEEPDSPDVDEGAAGEEAPKESRPEPKVVHSRMAEPEPPMPAYPKVIDSWNFPPLNLLHDPETNFNAQQESIVREKAKMLEQTLEEFRLDARVVEIDTGPVITMFELQLGPGIKVSQIASLANDIARALRAPAVRVVAPIPGKDTVGIEVPNVDKEKVRLKELMLLAEGKIHKMALPLCFGKDASGAALVSDLAKMPHMLIAGTTGSGKSVCINSIIASLLMTKKPDMVKLILVDPKMVELAQFKDVPHLMSPIITDMNRAEQILDWAVTKMEERYELLAEARVRNIATFNKLTEEEIYDRFQPSNDAERAQIPKHLPYIVVIIDELADLMMTAAKEVEHHLARLAQKSRAVGIHIVVATQRPEAKVVTGLIKSNMPCRCAFRVASRMDSRIVLDQNGAEVLMGQGDMLFLPPGSHKLIRAQGTLLEDDELHRIIDFLADQAGPEFHPQLMKIKPKGLGDDADRDPLFDQAVRIVLETKRGSVSLLQRRLTIGYSRASRLIDQMAEAGVVGEFKGSQAREVEMTLEEWDALKASVAADIAQGYKADEEDFEEETGTVAVSFSSPSVEVKEEPVISVQSSVQDSVEDSDQDSDQSNVQSSVADDDEDEDDDSEYEEEDEDDEEEDEEYEEEDEEEEDGDEEEEDEDDEDGEEEDEEEYEEEDEDEEEEDEEEEDDDEEYEEDDEEEDEDEDDEEEEEE